MQRIVLVLTFLLMFTSISNAWTDPVLVQGINGPEIEWMAYSSPDNLSMYWSQRPNEYSPWQLYTASRLTTADPYSNAIKLSNFENPNHVWGGWISSDNLHMYYSTTGTKYTIRMATRASENEPWIPGQSLGGAFSSLSNYHDPHLTPDELTMVFNTHTSTAYREICIATRTSKDSPWGNIQSVSELNLLNYEDAFPCITPDALTIYFGSTRNGLWQVFTSSRESVTGKFSEPVALTMFDDYKLNSLSSDGTRLYLSTPYNTGIFVSYIPEPCTIALVGCGMLMLRRRLS